jgi:hypothetical protein
MVFLHSWNVSILEDTIQELRQKYPNQKFLIANNPGDRFFYRKGRLE